MKTARQGFAPGQHEIEAYGRGGFRFGGISHVGSILALPSGVRAWTASAPVQISPETLAGIVGEADRIDLCFIGTGERLAPLSLEARAFLAANSIRFEALATPTAARTYNVLLREGRRVAAALIAVA